MQHLAKMLQRPFRIIGHALCYFAFMGCYDYLSIKRCTALIMNTNGVCRKWKFHEVKKGHFGDIKMGLADGIKSVK